MQCIDQRFDDIKELVNQSLGRMEALMERNLLKHENISERLNKNFDIINEKFNILEVKLDKLQYSFLRNLVLMSIIIMFTIAIVQRFLK